jgi:large subunit ribosomal protein L7e
LVVRIKGINKVAPKPKKILQLFRLTQIGTAVFIKNNKATMNMLRVIEPWVTYGAPSRKTVKALIYKRGYGKINRQRIPLSSNEVV